MRCCEKRHILREADRECRELLTPDKLAEIVDLVPDEWLQWDGTELTPRRDKGCLQDFPHRAIEKFSHILKTGDRCTTSALV